MLRDVDVGLDHVWRKGRRQSKGPWLEQTMVYNKTNKAKSNNGKQTNYLTGAHLYVINFHFSSISKSRVPRSSKNWVCWEVPVQNGTIERWVVVPSKLKTFQTPLIKPGEALECLCWHRVSLDNNFSDIHKRSSNIPHLQGRGCHWENVGTTPSFSKYSSSRRTVGENGSNSRSCFCAENEGGGFTELKSKHPMALEIRYTGSVERLSVSGTWVPSGCRVVCQI